MELTPVTSHIALTKIVDQEKMMLGLPLAGRSKLEMPNAKRKTRRGGREKRV
jgi:hypothetical protein